MFEGAISHKTRQVRSEQLMVKSNRIQFAEILSSDINGKTSECSGLT